MVSEMEQAPSQAYMISIYPFPWLVTPGYFKTPKFKGHVYLSEHMSAEVYLDMSVAGNGLINSFRAVDMGNSNTCCVCLQVNRCEGRRELI
jgi:hypothetical protein